MFSFSILPAPIFEMIYDLLSLEEQARLSRVEKFSYKHYGKKYSDIPFLFNINILLTRMGYFLSLPIISSMRDKEVQIRIYNFLIAQQEIRRKLTPFYAKKSLLTNSEMEKCLSLIKSVLNIPLEQENNYLEELLTLRTIEKEKTEINPIFIRSYLEAYQLSNLPHRSEHESKKIFLLSLLLLKLGDFSGIFSLLDLFQKSLKTDNSLKNYLYKFLDTLSSYSRIFPSKTPETGVTDFFLNTAYAALSSYVKLPNFDETKEFLLKFDFLTAFFYPKVTVAILRKNLEQYALKGLNIFLNIPEEIVFLANQFKDFTVFYTKIFDVNGEANLTFLNTHLEKKGCEHFLRAMYVVFQDRQLFDRLPVEHICNLPQKIIDILEKNPRLFTLSTWTNENILKLDPYADKLKKIPEIISLWTCEQILDLVKHEQEDFLNLFKHCNHRSLIFRKFKYNDLLKLAKTRFSGNSVLAILTENENQIFCSIILNDFSITVENFLKCIKSNSFLQKLFSCKNIGTIIKAFPKYRLILKNCLAPDFFDSELDYLMSLSSDRDVFLLGSKLSEYTISKIQQNQKIFSLLSNRILLEIIARNSLSLVELNNNSDLILKLSQKLDVKFHKIFSNFEFKFIVELERIKILNAILDIKSHSLFVWTLLDISKDLFSSSLEDEKEIVKFSPRSFEDITKIVKSGILLALSRFCLYSLNEDPRPCDIYLLKHFSLEELYFLNDTRLEKEISLLERICSLNPSFFLIFSHDKKKIEIDELTSFYSQDILAILNISAHGWLCLLYFNQEYLTKLSNIIVNNMSALRYLSLPENKEFFCNLIASTTTQQRLNITETDLNIQRLPSHYRIDMGAFVNLFLDQSECLPDSLGSTDNVISQFYGAWDLNPCPPQESTELLSAHNYGQSAFFPKKRKRAAVEEQSSGENRDESNAIIYLRDQKQ